MVEDWRVSRVLIENCFWASLLFERQALPQLESQIAGARIYSLIYGIYFIARGEVQ